MKSVAETAFWMVLLTIVSKLIGFFREVIFATYYGTSYIADAYVMAVSIPTILLGGIFGAISTAFLPVFSKENEEKGEGNANKFMSQVLLLSLSLSVLSGLIGILFTDGIVSLFASGFEGPVRELTSFYLKISFFYILFSSVTSIFETYLQYKGIFLLQIIMGYVQNCAIILLVIISTYTSHYALVFGWLIGYSIRMIVTYLRARHLGFRFTLSGVDKSVIRNILYISGPIFIGSSLSQINMFVDKSLASYLPSGSIAILSYSITLITMITGLSNSILVTIAYPKLAEAHSKNNTELFEKIFARGLCLIFLISIPITFGGVIFSHQIVELIYQRGAFSELATQATSIVFSLYAAGIIFISISAFLSQAYYSIGDTKIPTVVSSIGVLLNICLNLVFIRVIGVYGLALSTTISTTIVGILLLLSLNRFGIDMKSNNMKKDIVIIFVVSVGMIASAKFIFFVCNSVFNYTLLISLLVTVVVSSIIYCGLLYKLKIKEIIDLVNLLHLKANMKGDS